MAEETKSKLEKILDLRHSIEQAALHKLITQEDKEKYYEKLNDATHKAIEAAIATLVA